MYVDCRNIKGILRCIEPSTCSLKMRLKSKAESTFPDKVVKVFVYMFVLQHKKTSSDTQIDQDRNLIFDNIASPYFKGLPVTLVTVSLLSIPE